MKPLGFFLGGVGEITFVRRRRLAAGATVSFQIGNVFLQRFDEVPQHQNEGLGGFFFQLAGKNLSYWIGSDLIVICETDENGNFLKTVSPDSAFSGA